ncbi:hypothetical protein [Kribbella deserti]|uniref:Uncharacterized protein n=1 Tax=Kribbella deserti TaxID=1926257 RepID=A0ABV6QP04_9ACTN
MDDGREPPPASWWARWRTRRSTRRMRWIWGTALMAGFGLWAWQVGEWNDADWINDEPRSGYLALAAITYWPVAVVLWMAAYPSDPRRLPWNDGE